MPSLDLNRDYATVRGDPGASYMQDGNYFDSRREFVKKSPLKSHQPRIVKAAPLPPDKEEAEVLARAQRVMGETPLVPDSVQSAAKENLEALAAEAQVTAE